MAVENISKDLADFLVTKNYDVRYTDEQGRDSSPEEATTFAFDWTGPSGKNYGTVVIVIGEDNELMMFFGDNLGRTMEDPDDKIAWFGSDQTNGFINDVRDFATRHNIGTFTPMDINQLKHTMQGMAAIKEGLFEGYYGTRKVSYMGEQTEARLVIKHNRMLGENDKRYRYVESLFIETADGERFKLPFKNLVGGRAMLEHVRQGGKPYDIRGAHINEMVQELGVLSRFRRASQNKMFEGVTAELVESANSYYQQVRENLQHMSTHRGYKNYFESWTPADIGSETALVEDLKQMFIEQTLDSRIEAALPTLAKIQQQGTTMKEAQIFENWVNRLVEGTWALPDTPEAQAKLDKMMSKELIVGPDATNATEQLYDVVGDDQLFDILQDLAKRDPRANIWEDTDVQQRLAELGIQTPESTEAEPADVAQDTAPTEIKEGRILDESGETLDHILDRFKHEVSQFEQGGDLDDDLYDALYDYYANAGEMPYGTMKARTGDPYEWVTQRLHQELGLNEADPMDTMEVGVMGPAMGGQMVGVGESSCNSTMEGEYCPEHGLAECSTVAGSMAPVMGEGDDPMNYNAAITSSFYESELDRMKKLALGK